MLHGQTKWEILLGLYAFKIIVVRKMVRHVDFKRYIAKGFLKVFGDQFLSDML